MHRIEGNVTREAETGAEDCGQPPKLGKAGADLTLASPQEQALPIPRFWPSLTDFFTSGLQNWEGE